MTTIHKFPRQVTPSPPLASSPRPGLSFGLAQLGPKLDVLTRSQPPPVAVNTRRLSESSEEEEVIEEIDLEPASTSFESEFLKHLDRSREEEEEDGVFEEECGGVETLAVVQARVDPILEMVRLLTLELRSKFLMDLQELFLSLAWMNFYFFLHFK